MESVELALKNTDRNEIILTDGADDFSVDDLLDFSNNDDVLVEDEAELMKVEQRKRGVPDDNTLHWSNELSTPCQEEIRPLPTTDLSLPTDDVAELEWLSNFVEDSFTSYSAPMKKPVWLTGDLRQAVAPVNEDSCFKAPLPVVKIRTKRARTGVSVWSLGSPPDSSSSSSSSSTSAPSSPLWLSGAEFLDEKAVKRQKKPKKKALSSLEVCQTQTRRCTHCGVQKTPQWRAGPLGPKTLCNACGVRFKSGRLLPEYRPACSPTFSSELHSNHHRKVIEMRRKKETSSDADELGLNQPVRVVQSF